MVIKTSAHYQREHRKRLREQGLVKKEIWIRPEHTNKAREFEKALRVADLEQVAGRQTWLTQALSSDIESSKLVNEGRATVELIEGASPTVHIIMHEYGDLPQFLTVAGDQIIVESVLWPVSKVVDIAKFNDVVLRTHKYFPLSTISLAKRAEEDYYIMFGALSSYSSLEDILQEIEVLASNVIQATEAYEDYLI